MYSVLRYMYQYMCHLNGSHVSQCLECQSTAAGRAGSRTEDAHGSWQRRSEATRLLPALRLRLFVQLLRLLGVLRVRAMCSHNDSMEIDLQ